MVRVFHRKASPLTPLALIALASAAQAIAPAAATAMDGQGTGTGSTCIERAPGVFIDSVTREKCEPVQLPGETIVIHEPYKAPDPSPPRLPACSALVHKCGQAEEGRVPQQRSSSEKDAKPKSEPKSDPAAIERCRELEAKAKVKIPIGSLPQQAEIRESEGRLVSQQSSIAFSLRLFLSGELDEWPEDELRDARNSAMVMGRRIARLKREIATIEQARAEWERKGCSRAPRGE